MPPSKTLISYTRSVHFGGPEKGVFNIVAPKRCRKVCHQNGSWMMFALWVLYISLSIAYIYRYYMYYMYYMLLYVLYVDGINVDFWLSNLPRAFKQRQRYKATNSCWSCTRERHASRTIAKSSPAGLSDGVWSNIHSVSPNMPSWEMAHL